MSETNEATTLRQHFKRNETPGQRYEGNNRRAIGLLPDAKDDRTTVIPITANSNRQRFLVALEADQRTCCLKMASDRRKSRGALLIFRGRVLGTIYGSKSLEAQLLDQAAYARVYTDITEPDSLVDTYTLDEELAIATAALFHGQPFEMNDNSSVEEIFRSYVQALMQANMPGCVLVTNFKNVAVCLAYVFGGRLVGFYSASEGWLPPVASIAINQVMRFPQASVTGSILQARNVEEVFDLTFSLSGLADRSTQNWTGLSHEMGQSLRITKVDPAKLKDRNVRVQQDRFIPSKKSIHSQFQRSSGNNPYLTNP
jgi:hypothetical protein